MAARLGRARPNQKYRLQNTFVASVVIDAVSAGAYAAAATSLSWSHTCSGTGRAVVVGVNVATSNAGITTTVTFAGTSMTSLGKVFSGAGGSHSYTELFGLVNPPTGASTVAVTAAGGTVADFFGGSVSFNGADQTAPFGTPATAQGTGTTASVSLATASYGNLVIDGISAGSPLSAPTLTNRWLRDVNQNTSGGNGAQSTAEALGGAVTSQYTVSVSDSWGMQLLEVKAPVGTAFSGSGSLSGSGALAGGTATPAIGASAALSGSGSLAAGVSFADGFERQRTDLWSFSGPASVSAGQLTLPFQSDYAAGIFSTAGWDLTGRALTAQLAGRGSIGNGSTETFLYAEVAGDANNQVSWLLSGNGVIASRRVAGVRTDVTVVANYDPSVQKWLRIRESAGTIYWEYSTDGSAWTPGFSLANPFAVTAMDFGLGAGYYATETSPSPAVWDNVSLAPPGGVALPALVAPAAALSGSGGLAVSFGAGVATSGSGSVTASQTAMTAAATPALAGQGLLGQSFFVSVATAGSGTLVPTTAVANPIGRPGLAGSGTLTAGVGFPAVAGEPPLTDSFGGDGRLVATPGAVGTRGAPALSGTGTLSGRGGPSVILALSGSGALGATGRPALLASAALAGSGALAAAGSPGLIPRFAAQLSGAGALAFASGASNLLASPALAGLGALSTTARTGQSGTVALAGVGALSFVVVPGPRGVAALTGSGALAPAPIGIPGLLAALTLAGAGALSAPGGTPNFLRAPALAGLGALAVTRLAGETGAVLLAGAGALSPPPTGLPNATGAVALAGSGALGGLATLNVFGTATLGGQGFLSVSLLIPTPGVTCVTFGSGALTGGEAGMGTLGLATSSGAGTLVPGGGAGLLGSAALAGSGALAVLGAIGGIGTPPIAATGTLSVGAINWQALVAIGQSGTGTVVVTLTPRPVVGIYYSLTGSGVLAFTGGIYGFTPVVALAGLGALASAAGSGQTGVISLTGSGAVLTVPLAGPLGSATLSSLGALSPAGTINAAPAPAFTGTGTTGVAPTVILGGAVSPSGLGRLAPVSAAALAQQATLAASGLLTAAGTSFYASPAVAGTGVLALKKYATWIARSAYRLEVAPAPPEFTVRPAFPSVELFVGPSHPR